MHGTWQVRDGRDARLSSLLPHLFISLVAASAVAHCQRVPRPRRLPATSPSHWPPPRCPPAAALASTNGRLPACSCDHLFGSAAELLAGRHRRRPPGQIGLETAGHLGHRPTGRRGHCSCALYLCITVVPFSGATQLCIGPTRASTAAVVAAHSPARSAGDSAACVRTLEIANCRCMAMDATVICCR